MFFSILVISHNLDDHIVARYIVTVKEFSQTNVLISYTVVLLNHHHKALHFVFQALDWVEIADDNERNFIIFSDSKSSLQAIWGRDWAHPLVLKVPECLHWLLRAKRKQYYFIGFPVM